MFVINAIDVEVRDVADSAMVLAIRRTVQHTFSHLVGAWHVQVSASDECGRWDLHIRGGFGHHFARFLAVPDRLAERVERTLRAFLQGVVPPLSVVPRRFMFVIRRSGGSIAASIQASASAAPRLPGRQVFLAKGAGARAALGLASRAS
jgi:hypothetical protein